MRFSFQTLVTFGALPLLELVFPNACLVCGGDLPFAARPLCPTCEATLVPIGAAACRRCGGEPALAGIVRKAKRIDACRRCRGRRFAFRAGVAGLRYGGSVRTLIHQAKFHGRRDALQLLVPPLVAAIRSRREFAGVDCVVPVPLHPLRRFSRGFDQAEILARDVARELGIPVVAAALRRRRRSSPQSLATDAERAANVAGAFAPWRGRKRIKDRTVLLIDDVLTTGSTAHAAATALLAGGARRVLLAVTAT